MSQFTVCLKLGHDRTGPGSKEGGREGGRGRKERT